MVYAKVVIYSQVKLRSNESKFCNFSSTILMGEPTCPGNIEIVLIPLNLSVKNENWEN